MGALRNGAIEPEVRVAVVRILSGSSYMDLILTLHIARSPVHWVFYPTSDVLCNHLNFDGFPTDISTCTKIYTGFRNDRSNVNPGSGYISALDGIATCIQKPHNVNYLILQAIITAKYFMTCRFRLVVIQTIGLCFSKRSSWTSWMIMLRLAGLIFLILQQKTDYQKHFGCGRWDKPK